MKPIRLGLIGCGAIALQNYIPALKYCPNTFIHVVSDPIKTRAEEAQKLTGAYLLFTNPLEAVKVDEIDGVIITTPNESHFELAAQAIRAGKHVLCEKPLTGSPWQAYELLRLTQIYKVNHMVAFTYRFVPAFRYLLHLLNQGDIGRIFHVRTCRLQDWKQRFLGWRQYRYWAFTGEIGDMLSHRIDWVCCVAGDVEGIFAKIKQFIPFREGKVSELEDWVGAILEFRSGATGIIESSKVATGHGESWKSRDWLEIHGEFASVSYSTEHWNQLTIWPQDGSGPRIIEIPQSFWVLPGSPRNPNEGNPIITFRYDQLYEFVSSIREGRPSCVTFYDGLRVQVIIEGILRSTYTGQWIKIDAIWAQLFEKASMLFPKI